MDVSFSPFFLSGSQSSLISDAIIALWLNHAFKKILDDGEETSILSDVELETISAAFGVLGTLEAQHALRCLKPSLKLTGLLRRNAANRVETMHRANVAAASGGGGGGARGGRNRAARAHLNGSSRNSPENVAGGGGGDGEWDSPAPGVSGGKDFRRTVPAAENGDRDMWESPLAVAAAAPVVRTPQLLSPAAPKDPSNPDWESPSITPMKDFASAKSARETSGAELGAAASSGEWESPAATPSKKELLSALSAAKSVPTSESDASSEGWEEETPAVESEEHHAEREKGEWDESQEEKESHRDTEGAKSGEWDDSPARDPGDSPRPADAVTAADELHRVNSEQVGLDLLSSRFTFLLLIVIYNFFDKVTNCLIIENHHPLYLKHLYCCLCCYSFATTHCTSFVSFAYKMLTKLIAGDDGRVVVIVSKRG